MKNDVMVDEVKVREIRERLSEQYKKANTNTKGKLVRYIMPALRRPFENLSEWIFESNHKNKFHNKYYFIATDKDYLQQLIPASEYYKVVFSAIAEKVYAANLCLGKINKLIAQIQKAFERNYETIQRTGQPSFNVESEVYSLKAEIGFLFFISRSILDSIATLTNFLYGPTHKTFSSFNAFYKYITKVELKKNDFSDPELKEYFHSRMEWFHLLTDLRDYITHFSSIDIDFFETEGKNIKIYIENKFEIKETLGNIVSGISHFLTFYDEHIVKRLKQKNGEISCIP